MEKNNSFVGVQVTPAFTLVSTSYQELLDTILNLQCCCIEANMSFRRRGKKMEILSELSHEFEVALNHAWCEVNRRKEAENA